MKKRFFPLLSTRKLQEAHPEIGEELDQAIKAYGPDHPYTKEYEEFFDRVVAELEKRSNR